MTIFSSPSQAAIQVHAGTYKVPALVVPSVTGPQAVFNFRTRGEVRISLKGEEAKRVNRGKVSVLLVEMRFDREFSGSRGEADLLSSEQSSEPTYPVGNDFKRAPAPKETY